MMYNKLSEKVKQKYGVVYSELRKDNITTFKSHKEKWGAILNDEQILIDPIYDSIFYNEAHSIFECVLFEKNSPEDQNIYIYYDQSGELLARVNGYEYITIDKYRNFLVSKNDQWGLLDKDFKALIVPKFEKLQALSKKNIQGQTRSFLGNY